MISIPPEIDELIGEFVSCLLDENTRRSPLLAFALTSRAWLAVGRKHIFSTLELACADDVYTLLEILNSSPIIGSFVRELVVDGSDVEWEHEDFEPKLPMMRIGPLSPLLAPHLPNLRRLELRPNGFQDLTPNELDVLRMLVSVTEFAIRNSRCTPGVLYDLFFVFPHLKTLVVDRCFEREREDLKADHKAMDTPPVSPSSLKHLRFVGWPNDLCSDGGVIQAISMTNCTIALRSLDLSFNDHLRENTLPRLCAFLETVADSLVELTLDIYHYISGDRIKLVSSAVSKCTNLNTLSMQSDISQSTILFLFQISLPSLEHILFDLSRVEILEDIFRDDLSHSDLSDALSQTIKNCNVKEITFAMNPEIDLSDEMSMHYKNISSAVKLQLIHRDPMHTTWLLPRSTYDLEDDSDGTIDSVDLYDEEYGHFDDDFASDELEEEWDED